MPESAISRFGLGIALGLAAISAWGCGTEESGSVVGRVGAHPIQLAELKEWSGQLGSGRGKGDTDAEKRATSFLINATWVRLEAVRRSIALSPAEVDHAVEQVRKQWGGPRGLHELQTKIGSDSRHFRERIRIDLLGKRLQRAMAPLEPVREQAVRDYYGAHEGKFVEPAARRVHLYFTPTRNSALRAIGRLRAGASWRSVLSEGPGPDPGHRSTVLMIDEANVFRGLVRAVFSAPVGRIVGPVEVHDGWYVIERVPGGHPRRRLTLSRSRHQITEVLRVTNENQQFVRFIHGLRKRYRPQTVCVAEFRVPECGRVVPTEAALKENDRPEP